ncbi:unnamed protein product [Vicia faba]|uniref:Hexosyltransferase n=1 Tax=Vicia faba TaxID=3906 RepID=A0AAV0ZWZ6_VICFA|nr:unnamed protein product [Vicia faba]
MKQIRQRQRIIILSLLSLSVVAPLIFLGRREFLQDLYRVTYRTDGLKLNVVEHGGAEEFKEQNLVGYKEKDVSTISYDSKKNNDAEESRIPALERNGFSQDERQDGDARKKDSSSSDDDINVHAAYRMSKENITSTNRPSRQKQAVPYRMSKENVKREDRHRILNPPSREVKNQKVQEIKDQILMAKVYLKFAPPSSNSHLKELELQMKEMERRVEGVTRDRDLSRSVLQAMRHMEASLSTVSRAFSDCSMVSKLQAMKRKTEEQVRFQRSQATYLVHLAVRTAQKNFHCLSMRLTTEYFSLRPEERELPNENKIHLPDLYHYAVFSDNVLACAVVVNSTVSTAKEPEKLVFHISMYRAQKTLNDIFPALNKIVIFDHDVVVQQDLSVLWNADMKGNVIGAVGTCQEGKTPFHRIDAFINFTDPLIGESFDANSCTWAFGMNLFDLQQWRRHNLTAVYHKYSQMGSEKPLWNRNNERLPLGWLTFYNKTEVLDRRWHVLGLGHNSGVDRNEIEQAAVIHYDGIRKPWLDIAMGRYKSYWTKYLNFDHPFLQQCNLQA